MWVLLALPIAALPDLPGALLHDEAAKQARWQRGRGQEQQVSLRRSEERRLQSLTDIRSGIHRFGDDEGWYVKSSWLCYAAFAIGIVVHFRMPSFEISAAAAKQAMVAVAMCIAFMCCGPSLVLLNKHIMQARSICVFLCVCIYIYTRVCAYDCECRYICVSMYLCMLCI